MTLWCLYTHFTQHVSIVWLKLFLKKFHLLFTLAAGSHSTPSLHLSVWGGQSIFWDQTRGPQPSQRVSTTQITSSEWSSVQFNCQNSNEFQQFVFNQISLADNLIAKFALRLQQKYNNKVLAQLFCKPQLLRHQEACAETQSFSPRPFFMHVCYCNSSYHPEGRKGYMWLIPNKPQSFTHFLTLQVVFVPTALSWGISLKPFVITWL